MLTLNMKRGDKLAIESSLFHLHSSIYNLCRASPYVCTVYLWWLSFLMRGGVYVLVCTCIDGEQMCFMLEGVFIYSALKRSLD